MTVPRVLCVEYNAKFPPPQKSEIAYDPDHVWQADDYQGASLQSFVNELEPRGYRLICCGLSGANAFFVRETEIGTMSIHPVEQLYQPSRYHLIHKRSGHTPSLKFLRHQLRKPTEREAK